MTRPALTPAEHDLIVVLCEAALVWSITPAGARIHPYNEFTENDWARCRSLIAKLTEDEQRDPQLGCAIDEPETYTPPGGRL